MKDLKKKPDCYEASQADQSLTFHTAKYLKL